MGRDSDATEEIAAALRDTSVIIPVKDDPRIAECLDSIDEPEVEIVLALNGASDAIHEIARTHRRATTIVEIPEANLSAAYNVGVAAARGSLLLFMDSDCVFHEGAIRAMVSAALTHPVVKGQVVFQNDGRWLSHAIQQAREFGTSDFVNAYSPPLVYWRAIEDAIGGYQYSDLIHWEEDREFDFRLQLAGIPVHYVPEGIVYHVAQHGRSDLRSGFRYGVGEAIGQELGLFLTPTAMWRLWTDVVAVGRVWRRKGFLAAAYMLVWRLAYHAGILFQLAVDPNRVRRSYPANARRLRTFAAVPDYETKMKPKHAEALRYAHLRQGRIIVDRNRNYIWSKPLRASTWREARVAIHDAGPADVQMADASDALNNPQPVHVLAEATTRRR